MNLNFFVKGSESEPYKVMFDFSSGRIHSSCTCMAGHIGNMCKHRLDVLKGAYDLKVTTGIKEDELKQIEKLFKSNVAYQKWQKVLDKETEIATKKRELEILKKEFSKEIS